MTPGAPPEKYQKGECGIRNSRFSLVRGETDWQFFDLKKDPGQTNDMAAQEPELVKQLSMAYDHWWTNVQPDLVNEDAYKTAPRSIPSRKNTGNNSGAARSQEPILNRMNQQT